MEIKKKPSTECSFKEDNLPFYVLFRLLWVYVYLANGFSLVQLLNGNELPCSHFALPMIVTKMLVCVYAVTVGEFYCQQCITLVNIMCNNWQFQQEACDRVQSFFAARLWVDGSRWIQQVQVSDLKVCTVSTNSPFLLSLSLSLRDKGIHLAWV